MLPEMLPFLISVESVTVSAIASWHGRRHRERSSEKILTRFFMKKWLGEVEKKRCSL
jgi:hypothetical protein